MQPPLDSWGSRCVTIQVWEVLTVPTVVVTQVGLEAPGPECVCSFLCSGQVGNLVGCPWIPILGTP